MGLTIEVFKSNELKPEDFSRDEVTGVHINEKTANQIAASDVVLTDASPEKYREVRESLLNPESRENFLHRHEDIRRAVWNDAEQSIYDLLADDTVSDEIKTSVLGLTPDQVQTATNDFLNILAEEAAIAESGQESVTSQDSRFSAIDSIRRVNDQKRRTQAAINAWHLSKDPSFTEKAVDFTELLVPFAEWINADQLLLDLKKGGARGATLMGNQKAELYKQIQELPIDQRDQFTSFVIDLIENNEDVILPDGNVLVSLDLLQNMLIDNDYSDFDKWFDNTISVLDVIGVGVLVRSLTRTKKTVKSGEKFLDGEILDPLPDEPTPPPSGLLEGVVIEGEATEIATDIVKTEVSPVSPSQIVKDYNPEQARQMHKAAMDDETGEMSNALYGTNRTEAAANDLLPEPSKKDGSVKNKVEMSRPANNEPEHIRKARQTDGNTIVSDNEYKKIQTRLIASLDDVQGMKLQGASSTIRLNDDGTFGFRAIYRPTDSGLRTPADVLANARFAFRNYGLQDQHFHVLARNGDKWKPITQKEYEAKEALKAKGASHKELEDIDYALALEYDHKFRPEDLQEIDFLTTANGPISRIVQLMDRSETQFWASSGQGSVVQNLLDAASVIHPQIVNAASVAVDGAHGLKKLYVQEFEGFTKAYNKMPSDRRAMMTEYINTANSEGIAFNVTDLYNRGFTSKEIETLRTWRKANDTMWYAANDDMVKTLNHQGFKVVVHDETQTKLIGKPQARNRVQPNRTTYDPVEDGLVKLSSDDLTDLYNDGGEIVQLDEPIQVDGQWIQSVVSRNTPNGGYTRALYNEEVVLPYRDGYYPVMYDANYFIKKRVVDADGAEKYKAVASSKDKADSDEILRMLSSDDPDGQYVVLKDRSFNTAVNRIFDEGSWSLASNSGLTSQKVRGKRLLDASVDLHKAGTSNLKDPLEAVANQVHQLSQRVAMRTYLDTAKHRWMLQFGDSIDLPINPYTHKPEMPKSPSGIKAKPGASEKLVSEARTNFNYLYGLENGYINGIDSVYRGVMHGAADFMAQLKLSPLERGLLTGSRYSPNHATKSAVFKLFIASNPARQALIQRGQILMLAADNPTYALQQLPTDMFQLNLVRMGVSKKEKYVKLFEEVKDSGILEAVDAHTLIRDDLLRLADYTVAQRSKTVASWPINQLQKVGFDFAEQDVLLSAWLSFRDKAVKAGRNMKSQRVKDEVLGQARAYTLNMNRSGEMPYSQNTLAVMSQFFSFRHKALIQSLTNRSLTARQKVQLAAYTTVLFGVDATLVGGLTGWVFGSEQPSELQDIMRDGFIDILLNEGFSAITGEDQMIDWGDFAPAEAYGMGNMLTSMLTTDVGEMVANSPAGSLLFGANPRLTDAFKTGLRYFYTPADYSDPELDTKLSDVVQSGLQMFSGYSSVFRANYAFHTGKAMSSSGRITDKEVTKLEALMMSLGFRTKTQEGYRKTYERVYGDAAFSDDDVKMWYRGLKRQLAKRGDRVVADDYTARVYAEAWRVFGEDRPRAVETVLNELQKDANDGDYTMLKTLIGRMGMATDEDVWEMINTLPPGPIRDKATSVMNARKELSDG